MKKIIVTFFFFALVFMSLQASSIPRWITSIDNRNVVNTWICFQKVCNLKKVPKIAVTRIAADSKYWLWINGKLVVIEGEVKRGPNPQDTYYDRVDISTYLKRGRNIISILVWYYGKKGFSYNPSGTAALFFDCRSKDFQIASNETWRSIVHPAYYTLGNPEPNYRLPESSIGFDARKDIKGWESRDCNRWPMAKEVGKEGDAPWNKLRYRVIPLWKNFGLKDYVGQSVHAGGLCDTLICRLPYNAQVMPYIKLDAPSGGEKVVIMTDHFHGGGEYNVRAEYVTTAGTQEYENKGWMNGENVYYIYPKNVKISKVQFRETGYKTELKGYFHCDDAFLNKLWKKAQRTLYVTMRDTYMDCPDRERAQWWGDEVNESGESFYALSVSSHLLMKKGMYELIGWQKPSGGIHAPVPASNYQAELPGQMLASIGYFGFWNYYMNTGDLQTIKDLYPGVKKYMGIWEKNEDGTMKPRQGGWNWGDWGDNIDKVALVNAWYYIALKGMYNMAKVLDLSGDVASLSKELAELKIAFNKSFWNGKEYRHPDYKSDTDDRVQALAIVSGLADKDKYPAIFQIFKRCEHASPYMEKYVVEALFKMGEEKYGVERLKKRFAEMVNDPKRTTLYEGWGIGNNGFGGGTTNHAWSGGGLTIMSQYVCGVYPIKPGYGEFAVSPHPAGIKQAETLVPTIKGDIKVAYSEDDRLFKLSVYSPSHTCAIVSIPVPASKIYMNGKVVWEKGKSGVRRSYFQIVDAGSRFISFRIDKGGRWNFSAVK